VRAKKKLKLFEKKERIGEIETAITAGLQISAGPACSAGSLKGQGIPCISGMASDPGRP
jgi:hypothetical protein